MVWTHVYDFSTPISNWSSWVVKDFAKRVARELGDGCFGGPSSPPKNEEEILDKKYEKTTWNDDLVLLRFN